MNMINGRWHLRLYRFPLLEEQSEELSYPFRSVQCTLVPGSKSFFAADMGVKLSLNWKLFHFNVVLFLCEFKIISSQVSVADRFAPSYMQEFFCRGNSIHNQVSSYIPIIAMLLVV